METFDVGSAAMQQMAIAAIKQYVPDAGKYYPMIEGALQELQREAAKYLGDGEKVAFTISRNGQTRIIVIDATKTFSFDGNGFTGDKSAILINQELSQFINERLLNNSIFNWLKSDYEENWKGK